MNQVVEQIFASPGGMLGLSILGACAVGYFVIMALKRFIWVVLLGIAFAVFAAQGAPALEGQPHLAGRIISLITERSTLW